jgi:putative ABC transport system permease protein
MKDLWRDIRYSARVMLKNYRFALVVIFILALGISANSTVFTIVQTVLLRALPYADADRLVMVWETNLKRGLDDAPVAYADYLDFKGQASSLESTAAFTSEDFSLTGGDEPVRIAGVPVSDNFFTVLSVPALLGRTFAPDDFNSGANVAVLSHGLWQKQFGSDRSIVGRQITLNEKSYSVIGVMPDEVRFPGELFGKCDLWVPLALTQDELTNRNAHTYYVVARLKPQTTAAGAQSELATIVQRFNQSTKSGGADWGAKVTPLRKQFVGDVRTPLLILFGAVGFVLLIACINVANLLLARSGSRQKEMAIRLAIGASRARIVRQLLTESLLLSVIGAILGLLLAYAAVIVLKGIIPPSFVYVDQIGMDAKVLGFTILIAVASVVLFGLVPALQSTHVDLNHWLKEGSGRSSAGPGRRYLSNLLIVMEVSLSLLLLIGATLLIKSFIKLQEVDPGFNRQDVLATTVSLPASKYASPEQKRAFFQQVMQQIRATPGVGYVGGINNLPLSGSDKIRAFYLQGHEDVAPSQIPTASYGMVLGDYFSALDIPLVKGRYFTEQDNEQTPRVAIINETLARRFFGGEEPIGKHLILKITEPRIMPEVVGVVRDVKAYGLDVETNPAFYVPYRQDPFSTMSIVVRGGVEPTALAGATRSAVHTVDPYQPIDSLTTIGKMVSQSVSQQRLNMILLTVFAVLALILAAMGIYSVLNHAVNERSAEIGIRIALGASPGRVVRMIAGQNMLVTAIGLVIGLVAAFFLTRFVSSILFSVKAVDPVVFIFTPLILALVALVASYLPARKASQVDPVTALRNQ